MEPAVILFFASVLIVTGMICWTAVAVTKKIVAYKTLSLELAAGQADKATLLTTDGDGSLSSSLEHSKDEGNA